MRHVHCSACAPPAKPGAPPSSSFASSAAGSSRPTVTTRASSPLTSRSVTVHRCWPRRRPAARRAPCIERHLSPFLLDARQVLQVSERNERLAESASTDLLTALPNRRMLDRALGQLSAGDTVILLDLDHFKQVNDNFGHVAGDEVLREFGRVLLGAVRGRDVVGRFGGEEFLIVLAPPGGADALLRRLRAEWLTERPFPVTFSAGIAASAGDPDETVSLADQALYRAKEAGRDRWIWAVARRRARYQRPRDYVQAYLDDAVAGNRRAAVRLTLDLLDRRVPRERIVVDLLAAAQRDIGERWYRNEITPADEHLASGVTAAALDTLMAEMSHFRARYPHRDHLRRGRLPFAGRADVRGVAARARRRRHGARRLRARRRRGGVPRPLGRRLAGHLLQHAHLLPGHGAPHRRRAPPGDPRYRRRPGVQPQPQRQPRRAARRRRLGAHGR